MFKRIIAAALSVSLVIALCGCGHSAASAKADSAAGSAAASSAQSGSMSQDEAELAAIGDVEVNNGILTVSITLPADYVDGSVTQESLDQDAGQNYVSGTLNEDGSVTYKLTKAQYHEMLDTVKQTIDKGIQEMVDDDTYSIAAVEHNSDYTVFDVTIDGTEVSLYDSFAAMGFYLYGGMYGIFSGHPVDDITVNFRDSAGNIIETGNSSDMEDAASSAN